MAWLTGWVRRKSKIINSTTAGPQTNYQVRLTIFKGTIAMDPNITRNGFVFTSGGPPGNRIWLPGNEVGTRTIQLTVRNLSSTVTAGIEMNCSYGFTTYVSPGTTGTFTTTSTGLAACPARTISPSEQPGQPFARADGTDLNIWFPGGSVEINTDTATEVYLGGNVRDDFGDIRFTDSDGITLLNYWIESINPGISAIVWVKIPSIPASPGTTNIFI